MNSSARLIFRALLAVVLVGWCSVAAHAEADVLRAMSFNIRLPLAQDGANAWEHRRELAVRAVADERPDVIATQEMHKSQADYLLTRLPGLAWFGIDRRGGHADEHMAIIYRRDRLWLSGHGNFWLSETPRVPGSISWGHPYPRMVTWGLFEDRISRRRFYVVNTHFPYRPEDREARRKAAEMLAAFIAGLPKEVPVILAGDFNTTPDSPVHSILTRSLSDTRLTTRAVEGPGGTFHGFTGRADRRIDWILVRGFEPVRVATVTTNRDGRYPSDHFPIVAELAWKR